MIKMDGFEKLKRKGTHWYSHPFYTRLGGYKMCLRVDANGDGNGKKTHVSLYACLMHGDFDSWIKWPFRGTVLVLLVNQLEDKEHHSLIIPYTDQTPNDNAALVTDAVQSKGWGKQMFIPHTELGLNQAKNRQYLKDDCLVFHVVVTK